MGVAVVGVAIVAVVGCVHATLGSGQRRCRRSQLPINEQLDRGLEPALERFASMT